MRKIKVISLIVTILIMALIFFFSSQNSEESTDISDGLTMKIVEIFVPDISTAEKLTIADGLSHFVRKAAHFTIFAALGFSVIVTIKSNIGNKQLLLRTMTVCVLYAASDEFHQNFVNGRTMQFSDVLIDSAGAFVGACVFFVLYRCYKRLIRIM